MKTPVSEFRYRGFFHDSETGLIIIYSPCLYNNPDSSALFFYLLYSTYAA